MYTHTNTNIMPETNYKNYFSKNQYVRHFFNLLFYLIFISCNSSQDGIIVNCEKLNVQDNTYYYESEKFTGTCQVVEIDVVLEETKFKNGKKHKEKGFYYPSGKLKYEGSIKNDSLSGKYYQYFENGKKRIKGKFYKGYPDGKWRTYSNTGKLISIQFFEKGKLITTQLKK